MNGRWLVAVLAGLCGALCSPQASGLQAGAAKVDITPPLGSPLNGYGYRQGRGAVEVHDPLWARALYLEDDDTALFLVSVDLCVINRELRERVLELAPAIVPPENIILTATHNHSGTGGMTKALLARSVSGPFRPDLVDLTARGISDAMTAAYDVRVRAAIGYGTTEQQSLTKHRRHEDGPVDPQLGVIRVNDSDGRALAIVANLAAHPTTVGEDHAFSISSDFPGYYYTELERISNTGCVAMFLNGAEGNQMCGNPEGVEGWAHTESIGRLLAVRTKSLANTIVGREASLELRRSEPVLPLTMGDTVLPGSTILQTLEIDDLLLTFFPGEPCVEIGLELRRQALRHGYRAQMSVSLANDHLMYFTPAAFYGHPHYEAGMNFYGPRIEHWLYEEFTRLMPRAAQEEAVPLPPAPSVEPFAGGSLVTLSGSNYAIGYQRGLAFGDALRHRYSDRIVARAEDYSLVPDEGLWTFARGTINHTPLALLRMGIGARPLLDGLDRSLIDTIVGTADAVQLPFDAVWLTQVTPRFVSDSNVDDLYRAPFCTMFAATGDRAGADRILVGRTLDWEESETPVVTRVLPDDGHAYVQVGFDWNAGVFTGMNDQGLVVCAQRMESLGEPSFDAPPVEFLLRECLLRDDTAGAAAARVAGHASFRGYHVLYADAKADAVVVEYGPEQRPRVAEEGLLLGGDPDDSDVDPASRQRYARVRRLLAEERIVATDEIGAVLHDRSGGDRGREAIFNADTRHAVVFEPRSLTMHVSFPGVSGMPLPYEKITLRGQAR